MSNLEKLAFASGEKQNILKLRIWDAEYAYEIMWLNKLVAFKFN